MSDLKPSDIAWSQNLFTSLNEGGAWAVPRSGLIFHKKGKKMVLTARMPWSREIGEAALMGRDVPMNEGQFLKYQQNDFETIAAHFRAAGIEVETTTEMKLPNRKESK